VPTFADILSQERFDTYRKWASGDDALAVRLYTYNVQLSAALYGPLHMLEVALRNVADKQLTTAFGATWIDQATVLKETYQQDCVTTARATLRREGKAATHAQIVAELNYGFWSSLFGHKSHHLWGTLRPIFQAKGVQRSAIAGQLRELRILRNRVAHYEPILALPLEQRYLSAITLTAWLSPSAQAWISRTSNWAALYPAGIPLLVPDTAGVLRLSPATLPFLPTP
jgi:hypothetical protein